MTVQILNGDCREVLRTLPSSSVHCIVTSPPYFGLRDYGVAEQIGLEPTPDQFVAVMVDVFREVRRVLRDDGTLWLNLGDSYAGSGRGGNPEAGTKQGTNRGSQTVGVLYGRDYEGSAAERQRLKDQNADLVDAGFKPKDLIGIPWRVAFALQADGWFLRQDIIWHKPNAMPESVRDRCTKAHEYIFLLTKSGKYFYDADAIKEDSLTNDERRPYGSPGANALDPRGRQGSGEARGRGGKNAFRGQGHWRDGSGPANRDDREMTSVGIGELRNKRSVWSVSTQPFKGAHFATFPADLIKPCILAGCPEGGTVLDPFGGSGTTGLVADRLQRNAILIELNPEYAEMAERRIHNDAPLLGMVANEQGTWPLPEGVIA